MSRTKNNNEDDQSVRLDKWLWAARFYKTRKLAVDAISGGKIRLNGVRPKPSKEVSVGASVIISYGPYEKDLVVKGVTDKRGPAKVAVTLYEETEESISKRQEVHDKIKMDNAARPVTDGRPNKRERRKIVAFKKA